jgi:signal transduction histidine kinase
MALCRAGQSLLSDLASPELVRRVAELGRDLVGADHASLIILGDGDRVTDFVTTDVAYERRSLAVEKGGSDVLATVAATGKPVRATSEDDPCVVGLTRKHPAVHILAVPLRGHELRGVLWAMRPATGEMAAGEGDDGAFTDDDENTQCCFAVQAALALETFKYRGEVRAQEPALTTFKEVAQALLERRPTDDVLRLLARSARLILGAELVTVATPVGSSIVVRVADGDGDVAADAVGKRLSRRSSIAGQVLRSQRPVVVSDSDNDRQDRTPVGLVADGPALYLPMLVGERALGIFTVANGAGGRTFSADDLLLAQALATEAAMALEHGQIRAELDRLPVLEERERIAMDLHDGVVQTLFVVGLSLQGAESAADDADQIRATLTEAIDSIDRAIRDLRNYIFGLRPIDLADRHLERALRELTDSFQRSGRVSTSVQLDPRAASTLSTRSPTIIQAAREAMSNAVQHSGGDHIELRFVAIGREVVLEVLDNGDGFDPDQVAPGGHGLLNLRARAEDLGGTFEIDSEPGEGACVRIRVPI